MKAPFPELAAEVLQTLEAPPRLTTHLALVHEVAAEIIDALRYDFPALEFDQQAVLFGAATHDVGKASIREELEASGSAHEDRGAELLESLGVPEHLSRFARTHGRWTTDDITIEDLIVSLADKIWKGARQDDLEKILVQRISGAIGKPAWEVYDKLDSWLTDIASGADERLETLQRA